MSVGHLVAILNQIFHRDDFSVFVAPSEEAIGIWQIVMGKFLKYRNQMTVSCNLIGKGEVAAKQLASFLVYDVPLDYQTG